MKLFSLVLLSVFLSCLIPAAMLFLSRRFFDLRARKVAVVVALTCFPIFFLLGTRGWIILACYLLALALSCKVLRKWLANDARLQNRGSGLAGKIACQEDRYILPGNTIFLELLPETQKAHVLRLNQNGQLVDACSADLARSSTDEDAQIIALLQEINNKDGRVIGEEGGGATLGEPLSLPEPDAHRARLLLGVTSVSPPEKAISSYRRLMRAFHPDYGGVKELATLLTLSRNLLRKR